MNPFAEKFLVASEAELREILGYPSELATRKAIDYLDEHCKAFIANSPFLLLSTANSGGLCDVSPRGDAPGFARVLDDSHLLIPERPGNRRFDSIANILSNPHIGLIFIIPGNEETLRVNGRACITKDQGLLSRMQVNGKAPSIGIGVSVQECFLHCAKAFKRSQLWNAQTWKESSLPNAAKILSAHANTNELSESKVNELLHESYTTRLY